MLKQQRKKLGDLLLEVGMISKDQLESCLQKQKSTGKKLGEVLIDEGILTQNDIIQVLEFQLGIPHVNLEKYNIDVKTVLTIPESMSKRYGLIPVRQENGIMTVAMSDPLNVFAIDDVRISSGLEVQPVIATIDEINNAIDKYYGTQKAMKAVEEFRKEQVGNIRITSEAADAQANDEINSAPAVKLVNTVIEQAVRNAASDIHIEPFEKFIRIRYRIDGQLKEVMKPDIEMMSAIATRIKIIGGMNIAEKRAPQDGRINVQVDNNDMDLRVSVLPTLYGEKIVIRISNKKAFLIGKMHLGFSQEDMDKFDKILKNPHGIVLVTGPTGSGKTTTLYSAVQEINRPEINVITLEDPIESSIEGINQVQLNPKAGLTFASGLRSILRQDPNVIMLGEIRDGETAEIAVRAAITGHLVLATLHTNDAPGSILRLIDMGVERFMVGTSVVGVIAQRLVRKVCSNCATHHIATDEEKEILQTEDNVTLYKGRGCPMCGGTGYKGRIGIYEIMTIGRRQRELIGSGCTEEELKALCIETGMKTLKDSCREKVLNGLTTVDELVRVAYSND